MPNKARIDYVKVKELRDKGFKVADIGEQVGATKGAVSKILKKMGLGVAKAVVTAAPKYEKRQDAVTKHLLFLADKAKKELEWIEESVPPKSDADYREWQNQKYQN